MATETKFAVVLDDETVERLLALAVAIGKPPVRVASELLIAVLAEDEVYNGPPVNLPTLQ